MFAVAASPYAPQRARESLEALLEESDPADDVLLATSELVSNAIIHGELEEGEPIRLEVGRHGERLYVGVSHHGPPFGRPPRQAGASFPGGHGFVILDQVTARWDVEYRDGITRVWFET